MYLEIGNIISKASQSNHYLPNKVLQRKKNQWGESMGSDSNDIETNGINN